MVGGKRRSRDDKQVTADETVTRAWWDEVVWPEGVPVEMGRWGSNAWMIFASCASRRRRVTRRWLGWPRQFSARCRRRYEQPATPHQMVRRQALSRGADWINRHIRHMPPLPRLPRGLRHQDGDVGVEPDGQRMPAAGGYCGGSIFLAYIDSDCKSLSNKSHVSDSNRRPALYKSAALPTELTWRGLLGDLIFERCELNSSRLVG